MNVRYSRAYRSGKETIGWNDGAWLFPRAVQLLDIERYRGPILAGIVLSVSTKTDSTVRHLAVPARMVLLCCECLRYL